MAILSKQADHYGDIRSKVLYIFCGVCFTLLLVERILVVFSYHGFIAGIDNNFTYPVMRLLKSLSIYPDPENYPFAVNPYAPLFFYISFIICKITGVTAADGIHIYFVTRGLCLLFDLLTVCMLYKTMRKWFSISAQSSTLTSLCFLFLVSWWGYSMNRSDSLLLLWFSLILYYTLQLLNTRSATLLFVVALLCNAAIFTKQNGLIFPVAIGATLMYYKHWKQLLTFSLSFITIFALCLWLFMSLYPQGFFLAHLAKAINNRIDIKWFYIDIFRRLVSSFAIIPIAGGIYLAVRWFFKSKLTTIKTVSIFTIILTAWAISIAFKWGSHLGYFHEILFCITILLAYGMERPGIFETARKILYPALFVLAFILSEILFHIYLYNLNNRNEEKAIYQAQKNVSDTLLPELKKDSYIFAYTNFYEDFFKILMQDKVILPNMDAVDCCTLPDGNFSYKKLAEGFENGKVEFIVYAKDSVFTAYHDMSLHKYTFYKAIGDYSVYRFNP
ncbi:MAG: hypothetical protein QM731_25745 [Chitinophagaceae bacterium]